jgi:uncharacterized membrane protein YfcA
MIGMGLPTVAMALLGLLIAPIEAAALLVIPSLVTNVWQFVSGESKIQTLKRLWPMLTFVCIGTGFGIHFLTATASAWPNITLGSVLALYALIALFHPKFSIPIKAEKILAPVIGLLTGVLTGATGVFVMPAVPYISSLNLTKDELIQALGLSFTVSTIALAVGLGLSASYAPSQFMVSLIAVLPSMLGMYIGQKSRNKIDPMTFRQYFFGALVILGSYMALHAAYKIYVV